MSEARVMIHDHVAEIIPAKFGVVREMDGNIIRLTRQSSCAKTASRKMLLTTRKRAESRKYTPLQFRI